MKSYKNQNQLLDESIAALKLKRELQVQDFRSQYHQVVNNLKPSNLISQSISSLKSDPSLKGNIKNSLISTFGGYLSKKIVVGKSKSLLRNVLGLLIQASVTHFISDKTGHKLDD